MTGETSDFSQNSRKAVAMKESSGASGAHWGLGTVLSGSSAGVRITPVGLKGQDWSPVQPGMMLGHASACGGAAAGQYGADILVTALTGVSGLFPSQTLLAPAQAA